MLCSYVAGSAGCERGVLVERGGERGRQGTEVPGVRGPGGSPSHRGSLCSRGAQVGLDQEVTQTSSGLRHHRTRYVHVLLKGTTKHTSKVI